MKSLKCDHSNESYWATFLLYYSYYGVQGGSNFWVCGWNPLGWSFKWKLQSYFPVVLVITLYKVVLTFESGDQIMKYFYWNKDARKKEKNSGTQGRVHGSGFWSNVSIMV